MRERENISTDLFSLAMGPTSDVRSYSWCIVGEVRFHTVERDFRPTTQNSVVMVISVLGELFDVHYPIGLRV